LISLFKWAVNRDNKNKMEKRITCFIPGSDYESLSFTVNSLRNSGVVNKIYIFSAGDPVKSISGKDVNWVISSGFATTASIKKMGELAKSEFVILYSKPFPLDPGRFSLERMMQVCESTGAGMVYSGYYENKENKLNAHPVIDYQEGSLRDDFNFGSMVLYNGNAFRAACKSMKAGYQFAGLYDLRLRISQKNRLVHIPELLYTRPRMIQGKQARNSLTMSIRATGLCR
jgi:hypothetical protein